MPIEYPVRDSFLMSCLSRTVQNFCATSSAVFPGLMAEMPSSKASLVALIASIFFCSALPSNTVLASGAWYLL